MMKKYFTYLSVILLLMPGQSCREGGFFYEGKLTEEERSFPAFSYVDIRDVFDVTLIHSDSSGIIIRCGEGLIPGIKTHFSNDTLIITNENHFDWTRKYRRMELVIKTGSMKKITLDEPCSLKTDGVYRQDKLTVWATNNLTEIDIEIETGHFNLVNSWINTGNYRVRGSTGYAYMVLNGSANLDASELIASDMHLVQKSIDDMNINVTRYLTYSIINNGNIICYSMPEEINKLDHTGAGKLIFLE
jgi:hypothetical protein